MTAKDYILKRLNGIKDIKVIPTDNLVDFIYSTIMSKKFRKYSVPIEAQQLFHAAIELNVKNNDPIKIALPFGPYKIWRLEESPEVDWAELFAMIYYAYWLKTITDVYRPGVWFDFCADDAILEFINNTPEPDTEKYKQGFRDLIKFIEHYLPNNFKFTFSPVGERYISKQEFLNDLDIKVEELKKKGPIELTERQIEMINFNVNPKPGEKIDYQKNTLLHDAYMNVDKRRPYHKRPDKLLISATPFGNRTSLPIGTTKSSVVKFQTGTGILEKRDGDFIESIYSPSQLEKTRYSWQEIEIEGLFRKNFKRIRIIN